MIDCERVEKQMPRKLIMLLYILFADALFSAEKRNQNQSQTKKNKSWGKSRNNVLLT